MNHPALHNNIDLSENNDNLYLYFQIDKNKYAINTNNVVEIMKLPLLDYPQKLSNNIVGLLNYNNLTINILDIRFYLDLKVTPYSIANQLIILKTDETLFGIIIDNVEDIITMDTVKTENFISKNNIIDFLYKNETETIAIINPISIESILKQGCEEKDIDIPNLFPKDDDSRFKLLQRNQALQEKFNTNIAAGAFAQNQFASFLINEDTYCIDLKYVKEFIKNPVITKIPTNLSYVEGIIALRGDFITVLDLKSFLNFPQNNNNEIEQKNIVVIDTKEYYLGFVVDKILDIVEIQEEKLEKSQTFSEKYILNEIVTEDKVLTVLNMKNILSDDRLNLNEI